MVIFAQFKKNKYLGFETLAIIIFISFCIAYISAPPNRYTLTTRIIGKGSVTKIPDNRRYQLNEIVQLTAVADPDWSFSAWSGDLTGSTNPESITIDGVKTVEATFTLNEYTLKVTVKPLRGGVVTKTPNQDTYHYGDSITLSQTPKTGYIFSAWSGDGVNSGADRVVIITGNMIVTASYTTIGGGGGGGGGGGVIVPQNYTIILRSRDQKGTNNNLGEIWFLSQRYDLPFIASMMNGSYTLSYTPENNYLFDHWETLGNVNVTDPQSNSTNLLVGGNGTITAIYTPRPLERIIFNLTLESREENGTSRNLGSFIFEGITMNTGDILSREAGNYTVTFDPSSAYIFFRWETSDGVLVDDAMKNSVSLSINGNGGLTAVYLLPRGDLKIVVEDTDGNQVPNATVTLLQSPKQGSHLIGLTDSEGSVVFRDVAIGQYNVNVSKGGYLEKTLTVLPMMNMLVTGTIALVKQNYTLTIRVLDQSENPLIGAKVTLFGGPSGWQPLRHSTDSSGLTTFEVAYLKSYYVLADSEGYLSQTVGFVIDHADDNMYTLRLMSSRVENETVFQLLILMGATIVIVSILILRARVLERQRMELKGSP